jgi:lipoprotein-anchoring transpeptidase ErfK/SrfK
MGTRTLWSARRLVVACALILGACLALIAAPAGAAVSPKPTTVGPPTSEWSWAARVLAPTAVRVEPDPASKALGVLQPIAPLAKGPMVLLVLDTRLVGDVEWTKLLLARRPNGSAGWVPSDVLRFRLNAMRITIDQSERRTFVHRNGKVILTVRNAVGTPSTPTPLGRFAIAEKIAIPSGFLGPFVMPTTGFSNVLNEYAGGNGRFALHGTSLPWLIGTRASHGCIRHRNADIMSIARLVSPGTPVLIRA